MAEREYNRVTNPSDFEAARNRFIELLTKLDGVLASYELAPVKGKDIGDMKIGMTVYESMEALEAASSALMPDPITQEYFSTFEPIAVQYAVSTSNT